MLCSALLVGIICQVTIYARNHEKVLPTIKDLLNLVTIAIPPALPLSLSIGLQVRTLLCRGLCFPFTLSASSLIHPTPHPNNRCRSRA